MKPGEMERLSMTTSEQAAKKAAELWPQYYHLVNGLNMVVCDKAGAIAWSESQPDYISLDALQPIERECCEAGHIMTVVLGLTENKKPFAVASYSLHPHGFVREQHPDEGTARLLACIKVREASK